jgi:hypothetical protein
MSCCYYCDFEGGGEDSSASTPVRYRVEGGTLFNSIVRLCVVGIQPALQTILKQVKLISRHTSTVRPNLHA